LKNTINYADASLPGVKKYLEARIGFQQEILDLTSLRSVQNLAKKLLDSTPKIDAIILNAGMGGWIGINWGNAIYAILTDTVQSMTWPKFKHSASGGTTKPQLPQNEKSAEPEPQVGEVFCANVFGHYLLSHYLTPLLSRSDTGRIIWVSSLEAYSSAFSMNDFQGIFSPLAYESSKRMTDVLALTSGLPATTAWVNTYFSRNAANDVDDKSPWTHSLRIRRPKMYVSHPGICATSIFPLPFILNILFIAALYITRWLGSMWHTCTAYSGACAPVWLALSPQSTLDQLEESEGPGKWGSAIDQMGNERVERTEVEGWGYGGVVGDVNLKKARRKGRMRGVEEVTKETRDDFVALGRDCWRELERLRVEWEKRLALVENH